MKRVRSLSAINSYLQYLAIFFSNKNNMFKMSLILVVVLLLSSLLEPRLSLKLSALPAAIQNQGDSLCKFAIDTNIPDLPVFDNWDCNYSTGTALHSPCLGNWTGILCSSDDLFVTAINLNSSYIRGTLNGAAIANITSLEGLNLEFNYFSSTIPSEIANLSNLTYLYLSNNNFQGALFHEIGLLSNLVYLDVSNNNLGSKLPSGLSLLSKLLLLDTSYNSFVGNIDYVKSVSSLHFLQISNNCFTSSIPSELGSFPNLLALNLASNKLSGTIPYQIGTLSKLLQFSVQNNKNLKGSLPSFVGATDLVTFLVGNNSFSGKLDGVFSSSSNKFVRHLDFSNNIFTGNLPDDMFNIRTLLTVSTVSNCFSSNLPNTICQDIGVTALLFNGMATSERCESEIISLHDRQHFKVPSCIFSLNSLVTLELAANRFYGNLDNIQFGRNLVNLVMTFNFFTGVLPSSVNSKAWGIFDISNNKFTGTLSPDISGSEVSNYNIAYNRFSGEVPRYLIQRPSGHIDALVVNLFYCSLFSKVGYLPEHDQNYDKYSCSSITIDIALFLAALAGFLCITPFLVSNCLKKYSKKTLGENEPKGLNTEVRTGLVTSLMNQFKCYMSYFDKKPQDGNLMPSEVSSNEVKNIEARVTGSGLTMFSEFMNKIRFLFKCSAGFVILVMQPIYLIMNSTFPVKFMHVYSWILSPVMLREGRKPGIILLCLFAIFCTFIYLLLQFVVRIQLKVPVVTREKEVPVLKLRHYLSISITILVSIIISTSINTAYVLATLSFSEYELLIITVISGQTKLLYNDHGVPILLNYLNRQIVKESLSDIQSRRNLKFQLLICILNNILVPCIVLACFTPMCFLYLFEERVPMQSQYSYDKCVSGQETNGEFSCATLEPTIVYNDFTPRFVYSSVCSVKLVKTYSPLYLYMFTYIAFFEPAYHFMLKSIFEREFVRKSNYLKRFLAAILDKNLNDERLFSADDPAPIIKGRFDSGVALSTEAEISKDKCASTSSTSFPSSTPSSSTTSTTANPMVAGTGIGGMELRQLSSAVDVEGEEGGEDGASKQSELISNQRIRHRTFFDRNKFTVLILNYLVILCTFGVLFPPLALMILVAVFVRTYFKQFTLGRLMHRFEALGFHHKMKRLEFECGNATQILKNADKIVTPYSYLILVILTLDIYSEVTNGILDNFLVFLYMMAYAIGFFCVYKLIKHRLNDTWIHERLVQRFGL